MSWQKKVLRVNLTEGSSSVEPLNMEWANDYLGERGLATKYLMESMDPKTDAMSPENVLVFATGPLTGTMSSTSGRYAVVTKGPLTNAIACSNSGGKFGAELKYAGYDLLILEGRSPAPVYLHIVNDSVEILPADELWGTTVWHTEEWLKARHQNPLLKVASIGVAGESGVRYACIMNDLHRAAGRSGVGAVMGVKNLKAIAVHGSVGVSVNDPKRFMEAVRETHELLANNRGRKGLTKYGTNSMIDTMQEFGSLPTRNFHAVQFDGVEKIDARAMMTPKPDGHVNLLTNKACFGCTIACGRIAHIDKTHFTIVNRKEYWHASGGLEYETAYAFGPLVGVDDIDALTFAGYLMNEHGMDPISFGGTLASAMELYEMGLITTKDTDGVELTWGNAEALTVMAEKTGKFEGFGQVLGLGSRLMCEKYGHPELSMAVKGQEFAGYDSRGLQGMGLGFATSRRLRRRHGGSERQGQGGALQGVPGSHRHDRFHRALPLHHRGVGRAGVSEADRCGLRGRVDGRAAGRVRRAHLEPRAPVQSGGGADGRGRHPAEALAGSAVAERDSQGQGLRARRHAARVLQGTRLDEGRRADEGDAQASRAVTKGPSPSGRGAG
jgi:aldehyde:ferredoxin oxidoreductase